MSKSRFLLNAYAGAVIDSGFWGKLIFDISGIRTPDGNMPCLREHNHLAPIGVIDDVEKKNSLLVAGGFYIDTPDGQEVQRLISKDFPMQSSIGIWIEEIEKIEDGEEVIVNGEVFRGEGVVARKTFCREISVVVLGADSKTSAKNLAASMGGTQNMSFKESSKNMMPKNFAMAVNLVMKKNGFEIGQASRVARSKYPDLFEKYQAEIFSKITEPEVRFDFQKQEMTIAAFPEAHNFNQAELQSGNKTAEVNDFAAGVFEIMRRDGVEIQAASKKAQHEYANLFKEYTDHLLSASR